MAGNYTAPVQSLIDELGRLPGIGPKSAQRIAFHLLKVPVDDATRLAHAITEAKARVRFCERCFNVADDVLCPICNDDTRDSSVLCVVEESRDIVAIERTGEFRGRYHVLLGAMSPLEGIGPEAAEADRSHGHSDRQWTAGGRRSRVRRRTHARSGPRGPSSRRLTWRWWTTELGHHLHESVAGGRADSCR